MYRVLVNEIMFFITCQTRPFQHWAHLGSTPANNCRTRSFSRECQPTQGHSPFRHARWSLPTIRGKIVYVVSGRETDRIQKYGFVQAKWSINRLHVNKITTQLNALFRGIRFFFVSPLTVSNAINVLEIFSRKDTVLMSWYLSMQISKTHKSMTHFQRFQPSRVDVLPPALPTLIKFSCFVIKF